jgi:glycine cleavage system H lipoate-binding protein
MYNIQNVIKKRVKLIISGSFVIDNELIEILPKLINEDQTGYLQNWFIGFNHRQIQDIIDFADSYKIDGAIIFVDFNRQ